MRSPSPQLLLFLAALIVPIVQANPTGYYMNTNYNMYKYDQTVQQFTPDGRLLQIEYAMQAAQHSTPVVLVPLSESLLLIMTTRRCPKAAASSSSSSSSSLLQERLVLVPTGRLVGTTAEAATHLFPQQQYAEMVVVALSGILSDSLSLLEAVQDERFERQRTFGSNSGSGSGSTAMMVARSIADKCQRHAFGGGLRPFGATLLVCGIQPLTATSHKENGKDSNSIALYRTDPSGSIQEYSYSSLCGQMSSSSTQQQKQVIIVGGSSLLTRTLDRRIESLLQESPAETPVQQQIGNSLRIMLEEQTNVEQIGTKKNDPNENNNHDSPYSEWAVEAVLVSTEKGILKLSEQQIKRLIEQEKAI